MLPYWQQLLAKLQLDLSNHIALILDDFSIIQISGINATDFLQGQLTCDVKQLETHCAKLTGLCDLKGRLLFNGWLYRWQEDYFILLPSNLAESTQAHLQKYAPFSKVLVNLTNNWQARYYIGPAIDDSLLHSFTKEWPLVYTKLSFLEEHQHQLLLLIYPETISDNLTKNLPLPSYITCNKNIQNLADIVARLTYIQPATQFLFIPQMINLEKLGGVSFNKGCYLGQEVVARTQHLGKLKRHLYFGIIQRNDPITIGNTIHNNAGEELGIVTTASSVTAEQTIFLSVLQDRGLEDSLYINEMPCLIT